MSRSLSRFQAMSVGLILLAGVGLSGWGLFAVDSRHWLSGSAFHVRAGFQQVQGIEPGTRVRIQGIDAGEVAEVEPPSLPGGDVVLRLRLDDRLRHLVRADAWVQIVQEGMLGAKIIEIHPGSTNATLAVENAMLTTKPTITIADVLDQVNAALRNFRDGEGAVGKELVATLQQTRATMESFQKSGDALREMPILRNYIQDPPYLLLRPDCERDQTVFAAADLFDQGRATLTDSGRQRLDALAPRWKELLRQEGAEMVVVSCADPSTCHNSMKAKVLTKKQSEKICEYLKDKHAIHKAGWIARRTITPLGLGTNIPPGEEKTTNTQADRIELLVFTPRG